MPRDAPVTKAVRLSNRFDGRICPPQQPIVASVLLPIGENAAPTLALRLFKRGD
jgi:hypothetical protein